MNRSLTSTFPVARIPGAVHRIAEALRPAEVFIVGGIVRDVFLAHQSGNAQDLERALSGDWDLATPMHPEEVMARLGRAGIRAVPTGLDHGTITAAIDGQNYEVTTYRHDVACDGRHAEVRFAKTLDEDLERRDFTLNALAADPKTGRIIDRFGGIPDLINRTIRAVGDPLRRFEEDYLRMLRAVRFAVKVNGNIEAATWEAIKGHAPRIAGISAERVRDELMKMLGYERPSRGFEMLHECGLLQYILPELDRCFGVDQNQYHADDVARHTLLVTDAVPAGHPLIRWAALMHDISKPECKTFLEERGDYVFYGHERIGAEVTDAIMRRLRFSNEEIEKAVLLVREHMFAVHDDISDAGVRRWMRRVGPDNIRDLLRLRIADRAGNRQKKGLEPGLFDMIRRIRKVEAAEDALSVADLAIGGKDLIAMGYHPGPLFGEVLNALLDRVIEEPSLNNREDLLRLAELEFTTRTQPGEGL